MVLVSTKDKQKLYMYFLEEGVFCCKKQYNEKNPTLDIPNINCFLVMRSLVSRGYATELFSWQWHYYFLTEKGIDYLRDYFGLPKTIIPNTYKFENNQEEEKKDEEEGEQNDRKRDEGRRGRGRGRGRGGRGRSEQPAEAEQAQE